jgi:hypothetical protein
MCLSLLSYKEGSKPSLAHSSCSALSSLSIGENPLGLQAIEFFATLSIYKTSIVFLGGKDTLIFNRE